MRVRVTTHSGLQTEPSGLCGDGSVVVKSGATLRDVLKLVGVNTGVVGVSVSEGRFVRLDDALDTDCSVDVYPLFGGG